MKPIYKRVLIKVSGEGLMGQQGYGISAEAVDKVVMQIMEIYNLGVEVCVVVGGGNIFRGVSAAAKGIERTAGDYIGMMATVMNAVYMQSIMEQKGIPVRVVSGLDIPQVCESYRFRRARRHLEKKRVVIFAGGTGNPFFTTDTGAVLRASEMECDALLKSTQVDGVYDDDPNINPNAKFIKNLTYDQILSSKLQVMDLSAVELIKDKDTEIRVFNMDNPRNIEKVVNGENIGTIIKRGF